MASPTNSSSPSQIPNANPNMTDEIPHNSNQDPIPDQDNEPPPGKEEETQENPEDPTQPCQPETQKNLTLEIPDHPDQDPDQDDPEDLTPSSPTLSDNQMASFISRRGCVSYGGAPKRRKYGKKRNAAQEKMLQKRLEILSSNLKPIPFVPVKTLDFSSHEGLLKRLGLWDFVHLDFDFPLRADLIAQLIASYNPQQRGSYVNEVRILVNRADLARALKLPVKKEKASGGEGGMAAKESEDSIAFVEELVSYWVLLHDDMWLMPAEVLNWMKVIHNGHFERVDWASLVWFMVDKELSAGPSLENCYYASHLQILIKSQREELLVEEAEPEIMELDPKDDTKDVPKDDAKDVPKDDAKDVPEDDAKDVPEDDAKEDVVKDVKMAEDCHGSSKLEEHNIELSLGGMDSGNNVMREEGNKEGKENVVDGVTMDFEGSREGGEGGQWLKQSCSLADVENVECGDGTEEELVEEEECGKEEEGEEEEEEEGKDVDFNMSPRGDSFEGVGNENLIAAMEAAQVPYSSGLQIHDDVSSGQFLASRVDAQTIPGNPLLFGNANVNQRQIEHIENDLPHHFPNAGNKRMRSDESWDTESSADPVVCLEQVQHWARKARMAQQAKEQEHQEMSMNQQQVWINEVQQRDTMIQHLHKARLEEQHKRDRLERELRMMENLLAGYRKALKVADNAFAEYRAKCQLPEEPIYKDAGPGGLVLSTMELEKQRLKQEEEERRNRLMVEEMVKEFEAGWAVKFETYNDVLEILHDKVLTVEKEVNIMKERTIKSKASEMEESAPIEE